MLPRIAVFVIEGKFSPAWCSRYGEKAGPLDIQEGRFKNVFCYPFLFHHWLVSPAHFAALAVVGVGEHRILLAVLSGVVNCLP